jgi:hypothetical protein
VAVSVLSYDEKFSLRSGYAASLSGFDNITKGKPMASVIFFSGLKGGYALKGMENHTIKGFRSYLCQESCAWIGDSSQLASTKKLFSLGTSQVDVA